MVVLRTQGLVDESFRYPNYWGTMPMAVYTFLERCDLTGKTVHPFCTHEGSGLSDTENDIRREGRCRREGAGYPRQRRGRRAARDREMD